jgi:hypothetical protein
MTLWRAASLEFYQQQAGANCSAENPSLERNHGFKHTRMTAIFKEFSLKTKLKGHKMVVERRL